MAAGSLQRINKFALGEARTHKKFFIIANIILGMGGLLYLFMSSYSTYEYVGEGYGDFGTRTSFEPSWLGLFLLGAGCCIGLMAAASVYRDMNSIQLGDVQLSLPMTANERYFSKLLALFYIDILPILVWLGVPTLVNLLRGRAYNVEEIDYLTTIFWAMLAAALFIDCVTVLCSVCCGALAENIYFTIISLGCFSGAPALIWYSLTRNCAGQTADPGLVFSAWTFSFVLNLDDLREDAISTYNAMLILNCAVSVIVMAALSFLYAKRDLRTVGTPIANRVFFECIMFIGLSTVYSMFFFNVEAYIGVIIVAVIYIVIHIISSRAKLTFKKVLGWLGKFALSTAAYVLLAWAAYNTGGFGMVHKLPTANMENAWIAIEVSYSDDRFSGDYHHIEFTSGGTQIYPEITDAQVRQAAGVFQNKLASHRTSADEFFSKLNGDSLMNVYSCSLYIRYGGKRDENGFSGSSTMRQYSELTVPEIKELIDELEQLGFLIEKDRNDDDFIYSDIADAYYAR